MRYSPRFILKTSIIAIVCGFISGYTLFQSQNLFYGPILTVITPADGHASLNEVAEIRGEAKNIAFLSFNDKQIYTDTDGVWSEKLVLSEGYNIIKLSAKDKFGRVVEQTIELVYEKPADTTLTAHNVTLNGKANN